MEEKMPHVSEFISYKRTYDDVSDNTVVNYLVDLKLFFEFTNGEYKVFNADIQRWTEYLLHEKKDARSTIARRLSCLKSYYKYLYDQELIDFELHKKIKYIRIDPPKKKNVPLQSNVFEVLDSISDIRDRAMLEMIYATGVRESELVNINIEDIDFENELVAINKGKGKKTRIIPVSKTALKWLKAHFGARTKGPIFINNRGTRLTAKTVYNIAKKYFDMGPHNLRHAFATHMIVKTGNIKAVSEMLGHANMEVTEKIYTHITQDHLKEVYKNGGMDR